MIGPTPPLRFRATVERNTETGKSPTGQPLPPEYATVTTDLPCFYWESEQVVTGTGRSSGLTEGPRVVAVIEGPRMLVAQAADIRIGDRIPLIKVGTRVIADRPARVVKDLWRQTHRELALEAVGAGSAQVVNVAEGS